MPSPTLETTAATEIEQMTQKLKILHHALANGEDDTNTNKMKELVLKTQNAEFALGFCGHFSAGKSTMINNVIGEDLLPSNPIPTSANLVRIQSADSAYARVYFQDGQAVEFPYPYDLDEIREFAIDGKVKSIEICHSLEDFEPGTSVFDTPGIDSTDEAHRASTESALHLADVIFYVTDYNHVLSEMNFAFLQQLQNQNKKIALIVNQIDKHSTAELDFNDYKRGIENGFASHHLEFEQIFFTSLKNPDHPENQFHELKTYIQSLIQNKDELIVQNAETSALTLIEEHLEGKAELLNDEREQLEHSTTGLSEEDKRNLISEYKELRGQIEDLQAKPQQYEEQLQTGLKKTLDSAILMPYETREAGRAYIESVQSNFKVGLLGSKKKTEQEREKRLDDFHNKVTDTASTLDWAIKELLVKESEKFGVQNTEFAQSIYDLQIELEKESLIDQIQTGATLNADYVLRYSENVAQTIKQRYRKAAQKKLDEAKEMIEIETERKIKEIETSLAHMDEKIADLKKLDQLKNEEEEERDHLQAILTEEIDEDELEIALASFPEQNETPVIQQKKSAQSNKTEQPEQKPEKAKPSPTSNTETTNSSDFQQRLRCTAEHLRVTSRQIAPIKGLQTVSQEMEKRAERLEENHFTVALFGAFSAGKSSFANALIGEKALPVSPNPTTAAINQISPVDDDHPHQTASVRFKSRDEILADVQQALKPFGETLNDLNRLPDLLKKIEASPFLEAVASGFNEVKEQLGNQQTVDIDTFYNIVANENKAVFVESIELYYDCPLTRQGITLVDTPGADSINARHTGVAFDYIKNADAILFVTYYNHAFSRADREFLIQLGRVKDSFAMDKMFFIVNAADLAASENELSTVVDYVGQNLISYGIRQPRIYPISSQAALPGKQMKPSQDADTALENSGMTAFEKDFMRFSMDELTNIAVQSSHDEVKRALRTLDSFIESAREDESVRQEKHEAVLNAKVEAVKRIDDVNPASEQRALEQEIDQLVYYVQQRVFLRYSDLFKEIFNPSVLSVGGNDKKQALYRCLDELLETIGFDLAQEMRATALRVENFSTELLTGLFAKIEKNLNQIDENYTFAAYEKPDFQSPTFENALQDLEKAEFNGILAHFRNPRHFFEKGGKTAMRDDLQDRLRKPAADYLESNKSSLKNQYQDTFLQEMEQLKKRLSQELEEYTAGKMAALSTDNDAEELEEIRRTIDKIWT